MTTFLHARAVLTARGLAVIALLASTLAVAHAQPGMATSPTAAPSPLCSIVSVAQFAQIVNSPIDSVQIVTASESSPAAAAPGFSNLVGCQAYAADQAVAAYGFDFFDSAANADAYYANQQQQLSGAGAPIVPVSGLGDMAFYSFSLFIAKGPVVIIIVPGDNGDQVSATQLAQLVTGAV